MDPNIPFETAIEFLAVVYITSGMLVLLASKVCSVVIETILSP